MESLELTFSKWHSKPYLWGVSPCHPPHIFCATHPFDLTSGRGKSLMEKGKGGKTSAPLSQPAWTRLVGGGMD